MKLSHKLSLVTTTFFKLFFVILKRKNRFIFFKFCANQLYVRGIFESTKALLRLSSALSTKASIPKKLSKKNREYIGRILFIDFRLPMPDKDAGSLTATILIDIFQSLGFEVIFFPTDKTYIEGYYETLHNKSVTVLTYPNIVSIAYWLKENGSTLDYVWASRGPELSNYYKTIKRYAEKAKIIFYTVDIHYIRLAREARLKKNLALLNKAREMKRLELNLTNVTEATVVLSDYELDILRKNGVTAPCLVLPLIYQNIPGPIKKFEERANIVFVGGFDHTPNIDAVTYFVDEIFPLIRKILPDIKFRVIGSNPPRKILELQGKDNIEILGYVKNIDKELQSARVSVAPLRYGAGVKGKVGIAMCNGLPCVATYVAAEGMGLLKDKEILMAKSESEFANEVIKIYSNKELWVGVSENSFINAKNNFSEAQAGKKILDLISKI